MSKIVTKNNLEKILLEKLQPSPLNTFDTNDYQDLKNSIANVGLLTPLTVIGPDEEKMYTILCGERRYLSLMELNQEGELATANIPCYVVGDISMSEIEQQLIIESSNLETRDDINVHAHRFQIIKLLKELEEKGDIKHKEITGKMKKYMNLSARYRRMYLQIFEDAAEPIREMVENGEMRVQTGDKIASLPKETQEEIAGAIKNGMRPSQAIREFSTKRDTLEHSIHIEAGEKQDEGIVQKDEEESGKEISGEIETLVSSEIVPDTIDPVAKTITKSSKNTFSQKAYEDAFDGVFNCPDFEDEDGEADDMLQFDQFNKSYNDVPIEMDTSTQIRGIMSDQNGKDLDKQRADMVIDWCKKMLKKEDLSDEEIRAVELCKEVVDKFM